LKLRQRMRAELKAIQRKTGITFIYITHDQGEALTMSDRVAVMSAGRIQQIADPMTLYRAPATGFVAAFVGENNRLEVKVIDRQGERVRLDAGALGELAGRAGVGVALRNGERVALFVRPEHLRPATADSLGPKLDTEIEAVHFEGAWVMLETRLFASGETLRVQLGHEVSRHYADALAVGQRMSFGYDPQDAVVLPDDCSPVVVDATGEVREASRKEASHV
ncbi:MAG TPA: TOBE domain-containing protein, partial [Halomonas sp.]|nr:TOBE domain-containing protein [Halomonas sp.]